MAEVLTLTSSLEKLDLKDKSQEELAKDLLEKPAWTEEGRALVSSAYELAAKLHEADEYKDQPYIYHLLRVSDRVTGYLRIDDPEIVAAALLHDSVEDHAEGITDSPQQDPSLAQRAALEQIARDFSPRTAEMVAAVTNEPKSGEELSDDEKLATYVAKVQKATSTPEGWIIKFADWCDNGLGIIHGVETLSSEEINKFQHKYGGEVMATFERRFREPDVQAKLDWAAKGYAESQLIKGHERLFDSANSY